MRELKENIHIQTVAKLLIAVAAIAHLIFTYVHTSALLLLKIRYADSSCFCLCCWGWLLCLNPPKCM